MARIELPDFKRKCALKLIESIVKGDNKKADKALKKIVKNNIKQKLKKAATTEDLI